MEGIIGRLTTYLSDIFSKHTTQGSAGIKLAVRVKRMQQQRGPRLRIKNPRKGLTKEPRNQQETLTIRRGLTRMQTIPSSKTHVSLIYN